MARLPRLVIPGHPHHVTQRGNRRTQTFFEEGDYALYKYLLSEAAQKIKRARLELSTGRIIDFLPCHMFSILNPTLAPLALSLAISLLFGPIVAVPLTLIVVPLGCITAGSAFCKTGEDEVDEEAVMCEIPEKTT